jgi:signal transduction histidine kinase
MLMPDQPSYERVDHRPPSRGPEATSSSAQLTWLIALPAAISAALLAATAGYLANGDHTVLLVLLAAAIVTVLAAAAYAVGKVRQSGDGSGELHRSAAESRSALAGTRSELAETRSELAQRHSEMQQTRSELAGSRAEIERLAERLRQAESAFVPVASAQSSGRQVEVFVNLSRRLQSLVHREIKLLDALENEVEDPDLLKGLFQVDHLATRIRRHAENLAVLGGSVSRRQWSRPVALTEVLRSAIAEVEHYSRVKLVPPIEGTLPGHAVASVVHLIAELIENATMFAPPQTQVLLRAQQVVAGVAVEVEDRGLGMQRADQEQINQLLANPEHINLDELLRDGRIGLYVVSMIARQHGIVAQLQTNIYGGTQAVVILPRQLLGSPGSDYLQPGIRPESLSELTTEIPQQPARPVSPPPVVPQSLPPQLVPSQLGSPVSPSPQAPLPQAPLPQAPLPQAPLPLAPLPSLPQAADGGSGDYHPVPPVAAPSAQERPATLPPLPRRRSQTHMVPQLQLGPPRPAPEPTGEHNPGLMASFMHGVSQGEADSAGPDRLG